MTKAVFDRLAKSLVEALKLSGEFAPLFAEMDEIARKQAPPKPRKGLYDVLGRN
ncbi:hypothetical protein [Aureimonas glaciei]|uniref:Uncharacterized protein n=1 Tax=Aureimonas glaciei TaxID=1776957 RepID=A0A917DDE0_9HYPH|nr:hypothetical protein [Aureimonas glaciei]GGD30875.1 hypothetical protein GCM10011335_37400 [Aureimonas glaciei]